MGGNFRRKLRGSAAFVRLGARRRMAAMYLSGVADYLPELGAILAENQQLAAAGAPLHLPRVQLASGPVTLLNLAALELMQSEIGDVETATSVKAEVAERRRRIKSDGGDVLLRAALTRRYGLRPKGPS